jgi:NAD dependent epimerase/dehydratase family.
MIIGNGLIARAFSRFKQRPDIHIFASGVSNSGEVLDAAFERERNLLQDVISRNPGGRVVYFGSCGVTSDSAGLTPYMRHKLRMESLVTSSPTGLVLRLPQVIGHTANPNTLTNYLYSKISAGHPFSVWANAERNLIDVDDIAEIGSAIISTPDAHEGNVHTIASERSMRIPEIIEIFERLLGKRAVFTVEAKGEPLSICTRVATKVGRQLGIDLGEGYAERTIIKYYGCADSGGTHRGGLRG